MIWFLIILSEIKIKYVLQIEIKTLIIWTPRKFNLRKVTTKANLNYVNDQEH